MADTTIINSQASGQWREALKDFKRIDVCHLPEYHSAYVSRQAEAEALLYVFRDNGEVFSYPFLLTPVSISQKHGEPILTEHFDIASVYGYSGPLSTTGQQDFLTLAWQNFDDWALSRQIIAEFSRYSIYADTLSNAHQATQIEPNREVAISRKPKEDRDLIGLFDSKTRNMVSKAVRSGAQFRELSTAADLNSFCLLYEETMRRNGATEFFKYDDAYFKSLTKCHPEEFALFGVFMEERLVAAAIALLTGEYALYHLGASLNEYSKLGVGNLLIVEMTRSLFARGIEILNLGGGRTTATDDSLYRFKRSNSLDSSTFYIGKRIVDRHGYSLVRDRWLAVNQGDLSLVAGMNEKLLFYR